MQLPNTLNTLLNQRKVTHTLRSLKTSYPLIDFSSNDYLGFSSQGLLHHEIKSLVGSKKTGASGSRLISGNSVLFDEIEQNIASFHDSETALIYNSGYDANLGLLSSILQKGDLILSDELIHASLIDGIRLSHATNYKFKHNSLESLKDLLVRQCASFKTLYVVVESVYSMDGDCAPLTEILKLCQQYGAYLIVDEAHAIGVLGQQGKGLCQHLAIHKKCFARIYTYGKAMGCHGAAIVGGHELKQFLINFSRPFIYTTAMPEYNLLCIKAAYQLLLKTSEIDRLNKNIKYFNTHINNDTSFITSKSAIHCKLIQGGNQYLQKIEDDLSNHDLFVKCIKSPTVKQHQERMRICLHSFNTQQEMNILLNLLK